MSTPFTFYLRLSTNLDVSAQAATLAEEVRHSLRNKTGQAPLAVTVLDEVDESPLVATETAVVTDGTPVDSDATVTFTATITADDEASLDVGWVVFESDQDGIIGVSAVTDGEAELATSALTENDHVITATYTGTDDYASSSDTVAQSITAP